MKGLNVRLSILSLDYIIYMVIWGEKALLSKRKYKTLLLKVQSVDN